MKGRGKFRTTVVEDGVFSLWISVLQWKVNSRLSFEKSGGTKVERQQAKAAANYCGWLAAATVIIARFYKTDKSEPH